jgi:hypothetical protein
MAEVLTIPAQDQPPDDILVDDEGAIHKSDFRCVGNRRRDASRATGSTRYWLEVDCVVVDVLLLAGATGVMGEDVVLSSVVLVVVDEGMEVESLEHAARANRLEAASTAGIRFFIKGSFLR